MRLSAGTSARAEWFDRNPTVVGGFVTLNADAPHGNTLHAQYTVPSGRKAIAGSAFASFVRQAIATTPGTQQADVIGTFNFITVQGVPTNNIGDRAALAVGLASVLGAGHTVILQSQDTSIGGSFAYALGWAGGEFDA